MSASNANAMDPSSKPGNADAPGGRDSRFGGGGGGSQLPFEGEVADAGGGVTRGRIDGGGAESGRALASAAAPVPFDGGAFELEPLELGGGCTDGRGPDPLERAGIGPGCEEAVGAGIGPTGIEIGAATASMPVGFVPRRGSGGGDGTSSAGHGMDSGRTAAMRVESMRTAAISVEPSVESE